MGRELLGGLMKYLITGGAGFIGHHLTKTLLENNHQIVSVDNLSTGSLKNVIPFKFNKNFSFIEGSAQDPRLMSELVKNTDVIYNLAASVGVQNIIQNPIESIENNIFIASNILSLAAHHKKRIFMFSTSEVYGKSKKTNFEENDDVILGPYTKLRWSYATSKLVDDFLARAYFEQHHLPVTMVRLFNSIGTKQVGQYGMVVPRFFSQAMANQKITVFGTGQQSRCFTDVRDIINGLISLENCQNSFGELVNIGSSREITIMNLANLIKDLSHSKSEIENISYEEGYGKNFEDMERRRPCCKKLEQLTGYRVQYSLEDTLQWIFEDLKNEKKSKLNSNYDQREFLTSV